MKSLLFLWLLIGTEAYWTEIKQLIENDPKLLNEGAYGDDYDYDRFNTLTNIHNELTRLAKDKPDMVTLIDIGQSVENRSLLVIKLSGRRQVSKVIRTSMWIDAGIHAREWIAPATAMYMIQELVYGYDTDSTIRNLLDHLDFYILPVMNPDGYEYTWNNFTTRFWRKNRRQGAECIGVDLNRNFDYHFGVDEWEFLPCEDVYHGTAPFSEPESLAVKNFLEANKPEAYITLHSYSQMWLLPYAYKNETHSDDHYTAILPLAIRATEALSRMFGTKFEVGTAADILGPAGGCSADWAKGYLNVTYSYTLELTKRGFEVPASEIRKTGLETFEAIKVVADQLVNEFVLPKLWGRLFVISHEWVNRRMYAK